MKRGWRGHLIMKSGTSRGRVPTVHLTREVARLTLISLKNMASLRVTGTKMLASNYRKMLIYLTRGYCPIGML